MTREEQIAKAMETLRGFVLELSGKAGKNEEYGEGA